VNLDFTRGFLLCYIQVFFSRKFNFLMNNFIYLL